jgi:hypothetical protein
MASVVALEAVFLVLRAAGLAAGVSAIGAELLDLEDVLGFGVAAEIGGSRLRPAAPIPACLPWDIAFEIRGCAWGAFTLAETTGTIAVEGFFLSGVDLIGFL